MYVLYTYYLTDTNTKALDILFNHRNTLFEGQLAIDGCCSKEIEAIPCNFHSPTRKSVFIESDLHKLISEHLENIYGNNLIYVSASINKHGRCKVNGMMISSDLSRTDRSSIVECIFASEDDSPVNYFGRVRFFMDINIIIKDQGEEVLRNLPLCYVDWFKPKHPYKDPISGSFMIKNNFYNTDHIISPRRIISRCTLISPTSTNSVYFVCMISH